MCVPNTRNIGTDLKKQLWRSFKELMTYFLIFGFLNIEKM